MCFLLHKYEIMPNFLKDRIRPPFVFFFKNAEKITMKWSSANFRSPQQNGQDFHVWQLRNVCLIWYLGTLAGCLLSMLTWGLLKESSMRLKCKLIVGNWNSDSKQNLIFSTSIYILGVILLWVATSFLPYSMTWLDE